MTAYGVTCARGTKAGETTSGGNNQPPGARLGAQTIALKRREMTERDGAWVCTKQPQTRERALGGLAGSNRHGLLVFTATTGTFHAEAPEIKVRDYCTAALEGQPAGHVKNTTSAAAFITACGL